MSLVSDPVRPTAAASSRPTALNDAREWRLAPAWYDLPDLDGIARLHEMLQ